RRLGAPVRSRSPLGRRGPASCSGRAAVRAARGPLRGRRSPVPLRRRARTRRSRRPIAGGLPRFGQERRRPRRGRRWRARPRDRAQRADRELPSARSPRGPAPICSRAGAGTRGRAGAAPRPRCGWTGSRRARRRRAPTPPARRARGARAAGGREPRARARDGFFRSRSRPRGWRPLRGEGRTRSAARAAPPPRRTGRRPPPPGPPGRLGGRWIGTFRARGRASATSFPSPRERWGRRENPRVEGCTRARRCGQSPGPGVFSSPRRIPRPLRGLPGRAQRMMRMVLDERDLEIIAALQEDARATYADIGRRVGLSPSSVHDRVRKLEQSGVIRAYRAVLDPEAIGLTVTALIAVTPLDPMQPDDLPERVEEFREVEDCFSVAGEANYVLKVRTRTTEGLEDLIRRLREKGGVQTRTTVVLSIPFEGRP